MWKRLRNCTVFLALLLFTLPVFGLASDHLLALKSKFPHGLLGEDYGILTMGDLAINACYFKPEPFPPSPLSSPYEYWRCYESKRVSLACDSSGIPDKHGGTMGLVVVTAYTDQVKNEYIERRPWPIRECELFLKDLAALAKETSHVCISGSFIEDETGEAGHKTSNWLFERLKTRQGCEGRGCAFTDKIKRDNCPDS